MPQMSWVDIILWSEKQNEIRRQKKMKKMKQNFNTPSERVFNPNIQEKKRGHKQAHQTLHKEYQSML